MDTNRFLTIRNADSAAIVNLDELVCVSSDGSSLYLEFKNKISLNFNDDPEWQAKIVNEIFQKINPTTATA